MPLLDKPETCRSCVLWQDGKGFVPDRLIQTSSVAIVAQAPGVDEERGMRVTGYIAGKPVYEPCEHQPLTGATGYTLEHTWLPRAGLQRDDVSYLNILKCRVSIHGRRVNTMPQGKVYHEAVAHCMQAHFRIPDRVTTIVAAGQHAFAALGGAGLKTPEGKPATISSYRGYTLPEPYNGCKVFAVIHPADLFRDRSMLLPSRLDWTRLGKLLRGEWPQPIPECTVFSTPDEVHAIFDVLDTLPWVVVDTEYAPDSKFLKLIGIGGYSDATDEIVGGQLEWYESEADKGTRQTFIQRYDQLIRRVPVWCWNCKADLPVLRRNIHVGGSRFSDYIQFDDAMLLHHVLWSDQAHDLEFVASLLGQYTKLKHLSKSDPLTYNWGDVIETIHIVKALKQQLRLDQRLGHVYERKRRLLPLIIERESLGLRVNQGRVERAIPEYQSNLSYCAGLAAAYSGYPLNLASSGKTGQLARYLATEGFDLDSVSKDDISEVRRALLPFSSEDEQRGMSIEYILNRIDNGAHPLLELRALAAHDGQILNHFLSTLQGVERVFPTINLHTQASGRHSTTNPPLATLPHDLVDLVLPEVGHIEWGYDWDQIELRIIAAEAHDAPLLEAFTQGHDIHTLHACDIFGLRYPPDLVDPHRTCGPSDALFDWQQDTRWKGKSDLRRRFAKVFVYRLLYGAQPQTCTDIPGVVVLGLDTRGLIRASENWLNRHPAIRAYQQRIVQQASKSGVVYSFGGRRRTLQDTGDEAARQAMNHPMQGGCTDVYEEVLYEVDQYCYPSLRFRWGAHDSQKWDMKLDDFNEEAGQMLLQKCAAIVQRPRLINGHLVPFPATFHVMYDDGRTEPWVA